MHTLLQKLIQSIFIVTFSSGVFTNDRVEIRKRGPDDCQPVVVAHRGASGYAPEHTLGAYALAVTLGADYVEPDLVMTKDGHLIVRHENRLDKTTDISMRPEFSDRKRSIDIFGFKISLGWFSEDFTLDEIKTLRAVEPNPKIRPTSARMDRVMEIPTFQEVIDMVRGFEKSVNRTIGIYPELKHASYYRSIGLEMEQLVVDIFHKNGYKGSKAPVYIQSFDADTLRVLKNITELRLLQLISPLHVEMATAKGLKAIATYANAVGPDKSLIIPRTLANRLGFPTSFVRDAHAEGLKVHPYTFRAENIYLPVEFRSYDPSDDAIGNLEGELEAFLATGIDGVFIDQPDYITRLRKSCD